jgi:hypothetical protein
MRRPARIAATALAALLAGLSTAAGGGDATGLSTTNFVDIGDNVAGVLDTHALAVSTMLMGALGDEATAVRRAGLHAPPTAAAAAQTQRTPCLGGGEVRTRLLDADRSGDLSRGDRFDSRFEACSVGGHVVSGRSEFRIAAHRFEGHVEITELAFRFDDLGSPELRWTGPAHAVLRTDLRRGTESYLVTYTDLAVQRRSHRMRWDFSLDVVRPPIGDGLARVDGRISVDGLRLQLHQDDPYRIGASGFPHAGQLTASDARGARLEIEAGRWRYAYRLFGARNRGVMPDASSQSRRHGT